MTKPEQSYFWAYNQHIFFVDWVGGVWTRYLRTSKEGFPLLHWSASNLNPILTPSGNTRTNLVCFSELSGLLLNRPGSLEQSDILDLGCYTQMLFINMCLYIYVVFAKGNLSIQFLSLNVLLKVTFILLSLHNILQKLLFYNILFFSFA